MMMGAMMLVMLMIGLLMKLVSKQIVNVSPSYITVSMDSTTAMFGHDSLTWNSFNKCGIPCSSWARGVLARN